MSLPAVFRQAARAEFIDAAAWYETERTGLGADFIVEIERCVAQAAELPRMQAVVYSGLRRVVARRFPYCVYYRLETSRIVIVAVFHARRDPTTWQAPS